MKSQTITVIVPRLPPAIDGLGDYGFALARQLRNDFGLITEFVVGDPNWKGDAVLDGFIVKKVKTRTAASLLELLPKNQTIFLNYVGYGYARRGSPLWLVKALEKWHAGNPTKLVTMFHELYAFGPVWTSQFWTSPLQRNICARLVRLSEIAITSKTQYADKVVKFSRGKHPVVEVMPIFSNVGEPANPGLLINRPKKLVVFGGKGPRARVYQGALSALERTCRELKIDEVLDLGPKLDFELTSVGGVPITCLGPKPANEVSEILSQCLVGFFNYPTGYLAKSGIFAAYCSHRLLPVGVSWESQEIDGVIADNHFWEADKLGSSMSIETGQLVADKAHSWYQTHSLSAQAKYFYIRLQGSHS